jgi:hypothetical protein
MIGKALIRLSAAALLLVCIGVSGCSEGSNRIYAPAADDSSDQLSTDLQTDGVDGTVYDNDGYPIYDDQSGDDQYDPYDDWIDKYGLDVDDGTGGGATKPLDNHLK